MFDNIEGIGIGGFDLAWLELSRSMMDMWYSSSLRQH